MGVESLAFGVWGLRVPRKPRQSAGAEGFRAWDSGVDQEVVD